MLGLTDSNGTLVSTYAYDPYGNLTSSTGSVANPWRFAGGYFDSSTGLYKFGTRYYDAAIGRWSQQDPLRGQLNDPTSLNRYLYAGDDPVNVTDPSGRNWLATFGHCLASDIMAPFLYVSGAVAGLGWIAILIYGLAGLTAPAWISWVTAIAIAFGIGVVIGCAIFATAHPNFR